MAGSMMESFVVPNAWKFGSLAPSRIRAGRRGSGNGEEKELVYRGKESVIRLPSIHRVKLEPIIRLSPGNREGKNRSEQKRYYEMRKITRENDEMKLFIKNAMSKKDEGVKFEKEEGFSIADNVERYFSKLEEYIMHYK
jgi:hypothetical protein